MISLPQVGLFTYASYPRKTIVISILVFVLFGWAAVAHGQSDKEVLLLERESSSTTPENKPALVLPREDQPQVSSNHYITIYERWRDFELAFQQGNRNQAEMLLMQIVDMRRQNGIPKITELAMAAVQLGNQQLAKKNAPEAMNLYRAASALDPSLPLTYYSQARAHLAEGAAGLPSAISVAIRGFIAPLSTLNGQIYFFSKMLFILFATFLALAAVFSVFLLVRYHRLLLHNALEAFAYKIQPVYIRFIVWVILFVPVLVLLGPLWLVPFWLMVFWAYARPVEKMFAAIFFLVFIFAYPVLKGGLQLADAPTDPSVSFYANALSEGPSPRAVRDLQQYISEHPDDTDASIMLAYLYKLDHAYQLSIDVLQKHILRHPNDARAYNNLAAIYYRQGETDLALRLSQKATMLDRRNALYKYNLSNIYRAKFNFTEAGALMKQARDADPSLVKDLEEESHEVMSDAVPDEALVWQRLSSKNGELVDLLKNPFSILSGSLFLIAVLLYLSPQRRRQLARQCIKCGTPFCKKCHPILKGYGFCTQCLHIFVKKDGVSPASRKEKMVQIEKYSARQKIISQLVSLILPGVGILYQNKTTFGVLILLLWLFLITVLLFTWKFAQHIYFETSDSLKIVALVCTVMMGALYLLANLPVHRRFRA